MALLLDGGLKQHCCIEQSNHRKPQDQSFSSRASCEHGGNGIAKGMSIDSTAEIIPMMSVNSVVELVHTDLCRTSCNWRPGKYLEVFGQLNEPPSSGRATYHAPPSVTDIPIDFLRMHSII